MEEEPPPSCPVGGCPRLSSLGSSQPAVWSFSDVNDRHSRMLSQGQWLLQYRDSRWNKWAHAKHGHARAPGPPVSRPLISLFSPLSIAPPDCTAAHTEMHHSVSMKSVHLFESSGIAIYIYIGFCLRDDALRGSFGTTRSSESEQGLCLCVQQSDVLIMADHRSVVCGILLA